MRRALAVVFTLALAALVSGCGADTGTDADDEPAGALRGRTFLSESVVEGGQPRALAPGTQVRLTFSDDGRLIASAGCNTMSGPVDPGSGRLTVEDLSTTEMGCDAPRHQQDEWLSGVLSSDPRYTLDGSRLTVRTNGTVVTLTDAGPG